MQRTFKATADGFYITLTIILLLVMMFFFWFHYIILATIFLIASVMITQKMLRTNYVFSDDIGLNIQSGLFPPVYIALQDVSMIETGRSLNMKYAVSVNGVWISLISGKRYFVSPEDVGGFISCYKKRIK